MIMVGVSLGSLGYSNSITGNVFRGPEHPLAVLGYKFGREWL